MRNVNGYNYSPDIRLSSLYKLHLLTLFRETNYAFQHPEQNELCGGKM